MQEHITSLVRRYCAHTKGSKELAARNHPRLPNHVYLEDFRLETKEAIYPLVAPKAAGSRVWDVDGNEYIDLTMGFGVNLFGHNPPFVMEALREQLARGLQIPLQHDLAGEAAGLLCELTGAERVFFANSGTEAVMTALRLSRAATLRNRFVQFSGAYHGHYEPTLVAPNQPGNEKATPLFPGVSPGLVQDTVVLPYGDMSALDVIRRLAPELSAVLVEPVHGDRPELQPREFLHELRKVTAESGVALIFDEMVTGFRLHPRGAAGWFDVEPDLTTYGKIVGGGMPIGVVAGKSRFMNGADGGAWGYGDESYPTALPTICTGTFCNHPMSMAAARAVLRHLLAEGSALQDRLSRRGAELADRLRELAMRESVPLVVANCASLVRCDLGITSNRDLLKLHLALRGVYARRPEWFLSTEHSEEDVERVVAAMRDSVVELRDAGCFERKRERRSKQKEVSL